MIEQKTNVVRYGNITTAPYEISFTYWDDSEIRVWVSNASEDILLQRGTDYSIISSNVVLTSSAVATYKNYTTLSIQRVVANTQDTDYTNGTNINAETIERNLDRLTAMVQQLTESESRTLKTSISEAGLSITLPEILGRRDKLMGFGSDGKTIILRDLKQFDQDVRDTSVARDEAISAATIAQNEGISEIADFRTDDATIISIIQKNGTVSNFTVNAGPKGDKGDKGDKGESGITAPSNGFFTMSVDASGNLWAHYADNNSPPALEYDPSTGNLYFNT